MTKAEYDKQWRKNNPEKTAAYKVKYRSGHREAVNKASRNYKKRKFIQKKKQELNSRVEFATNGKNINLEKTIRHHILKGRDLGRIITWMNLPASKLSPLYEKVKNDMMLENNPLPPSF